MVYYKVSILPFFPFVKRRKFECAILYFSGDDLCFYLYGCFLLSVSFFPFFIIILYYIYSINSAVKKPAITNIVCIYSIIIVSC